MLLQHRKPTPQLFQATMGYSGQCPAGYSGGPIYREASASSEISLEDAEEKALALAQQLVEELLPESCQLMGGTDAIWEFDERTKECQMDSLTMPYAHLVAKKYDVNPLSDSYHDNKPVEEVSYLVIEGQSYFILQERSTTCPNPFRNQPQSKSFTRSNCGEGSEGLPMTLSIPYWSFLSMESLEKANEKAITYLNTYGQGLIEGTISPTPPFEHGDSSSQFTLGLCKLIETGSLMINFAKYYAISETSGRIEVSLSRTSVNGASVLSGSVGVFRVGESTPYTSQVFTFALDSYGATANTTIGAPQGNDYVKILSVSNSNYEPSTSQVQILPA